MPCGTRAAARAGGIVLVNNAGFGFTKPALETEEADWDRLFDTHVKATFFASRAIAPLMIERGYGKIVNMSSTWSASTDAGKAAYAAAKGAVSRITASLSTEWAPLGVRVNALAPTTTMTEFTSKVMEASPERAERLLAKIKLGRYARARRPHRPGAVPGERGLGLRHRPHAVRRRRLARRQLNHVPRE